MNLTEQLVAEHELIDRVVGGLRTYVARRIAGVATEGDAPEFLTFFRVFVGRFHHDREESVLFPALSSHLGLTAERGPIPALTAQHHELETCLNALEPWLLSSNGLDAATHFALDDLSRRYAHGLWQHIDAENTVLFPEAVARLERVSVFELPSRKPTTEELEARDHGDRLAGCYPPAYDPSAIRGEGCVICPSYGTTCEGVERSWWSEAEWEAFARNAG